METVPATTQLFGELEKGGYPITNLMIPVNGAPVSMSRATLSTNLTGNNNDLVWTAVPTGTEGNDITIEYIDPGDDNVPLSCAVEGNAIAITLETDGDSLIVTTADDIKALTEFAALVTVEDKAANDGSGVVTAMAATPLAGGVNGLGFGNARKGSFALDTDNDAIYVNLGTAHVPVWKRLATEDDLA